MSKREAIRIFHKNNPQISAKELARKFKTTASYVYNWWKGPKKLHTPERGDRIVCVV